MLTHIATIRGRAITWDHREVVQHGLNADRVELVTDREWQECDRVIAVLAKAGKESVRVDAGDGFFVPSALMEDAGPLRMCLLGYKGDSVRIVTAKEDAPLCVVESGEVAGMDPAPEQPDLWAQLMEEVRKATDGAKTAAQSATRAEADLRAAAERGDFDGDDGKTPVRGVDYWTAEDRKPIEDATLAATTAAGRADAAAATATEGEASRVAAETARANAETVRVEAEATRAANESERAETFNANLISWNGKVDAACKKATDTASKAAQDAKTATDAAIAKTEEATNAAVAKAQTATDNATTAANKAETVVAQLPIPSGNVLKGEAEATLAHVDDAYPAPLVTTKVLGQSNQQQEPAPSPENPQEITNLNKAEIVTTGKNLLEIYSLPNQPDSGISASMENDKSVTVNGMTTSSNIDIKIIGENTRVTLPAGVYTFSVDSIGFPKDCIFFIRNASDNTWLANTNVEKPTITISLDKPTIISEISVRIPTAGTKFSNARIAVQLEVGGKATGYTAPATKALTPIDLKGNELCSLPNGVKDEVVIDAEGNVSLIKRTKQHSWNCQAIHQGTAKNYAVESVDGIGPNYSGLVADKAINATNGQIGTCYVNQRMIHVVVPESMTTKEQANQLYGGMRVIYQLAEPQTIPLGKVELPALPEATSSVWNDGNIPANVYINYLKDVNIAFADLESKLTQAVVATAANL